MTIKDCFSKLPKVKAKDRILLLTHNDLDAGGSTIVAKCVFPSIEVMHCSNNNMSWNIRSTILDDNTVARYDYIIACDISCKAEDAEVINKSKNAKKLIVLDHHPTATGLNQYKWASVVVDIIEDCDRIDRYPEKKGHSSGASLMYDYLNFLGLIPENLKDQLRELAFIVSTYDTWDWVDIFNKSDAVKDCYDFTLLTRIYSLEGFEKKMYQTIIKNAETGSKDVYSADDYLLLETEKNRINYALQGIAKSIHTGNMKIGNDYYSIVFCNMTDYTQETFEFMKTKYPDYDYYFMMMGSQVAIRATKANIHAGMFAKERGGGGHAGAAGVPIPFATQVSRLAESLGVEIIVDEKL